MNIKRELIAMTVRLLAENTSLVRKPDSFENLLNSFCNIEPYDQQLARKIEADLDRAKDATKRAVTNRKFKKITKNI